MVKGIETTYLDFTRKTAKYPKRREKEYLMIGLMNEAGEVGGAYKKEIRDRVDNTELIIDELGDVLWYLQRLCDVYDIKISERVCATRGCNIMFGYEAGTMTTGGSNIAMGRYSQGTGTVRWSR